MKYLLIPIEEINSRIKEIKRELYQDIKTNELNSLKSKGEIVEIENNLQQYYDNMENSSEGKEYNAWKFNKHLEGYTFCDFLKDYHNKKGFKLIKTVK